MTELLTAAQMRAIEAAAIASGAVTGLELMERAGAGVVQAIFDEWPQLRAGSFRAVVLCGPGNNGGDGFVVARLLKEWGWQVEVFLCGTPESMPPDARVNYKRWVAMGVVRLMMPDSQAVGRACDLFIDALFGTGLTRPVSAEVLSVLQEFSDAFLGSARVVSVDICSGLCADSGRVLGPGGGGLPVILRPDMTVTFHRSKSGHFLDLGPAASGKLKLIDIGLSKLSRSTALVGPPFQRLGKSSGHKFTHGHAFILCGPSGHGGAARMTARGALRIGAGLVTLGCLPDSLSENAARLDAIMLKTVEDWAGLTEILQDARINALCLGPGMGTGPREAAMVAVALGGPPLPCPPHEGEGGGLGHASSHPDAAHSLPLTAPVPRGAALGTVALRSPLPASPDIKRGRGRDEQVAAIDGQALSLPPVVQGLGAPAPTRPEAPTSPHCTTPLRATILDADALTLIARDATLFALLHPQCILTPHAGEFARLFPDIAAKLDAPATKGPAYSKVDATRDAAARANCTVLFKGPDTVIAHPDGRCAINSAAYDRAAPWLATAGSGDVLAGFITGLLARGFAPFDAACTAAWLQVECARSFGSGLIAEDLPEELPKVFRALGI